MELKDYLRILRRRWLTVLIVATLFMGMSFFYMSGQPPTYSAMAELQIKESMYPPAASDLPLYQEYTSRETRIAILRTRPVIRKAIKEHLAEQYFPDVFRKDGVPTGTPPSERPVNEDLMTSYINALRAGLEVAQEKDTDIVYLSYVDPNPQRAIDIVNAVAEAYRIYSTEVANEGLIRAKAFIEQVLVERTRAIEDIEKRLSQYPAIPPLSPLDIEIKDAVDQLSRLRETSTKNTLEIAMLEEQISLLSSMLNDGNVVASRPGASQPTRLGRLIDELDEKEKQLGDMRRRYTEDYPPLKDVKDEIARLNQKILKEYEREESINLVDAKFSAIGRIHDDIVHVKAMRGHNVKISGQIKNQEQAYLEILNRPRPPEQKEQQEKYAQKMFLERELVFMKGSKQDLERTRNNLDVNMKLIRSPVEKIEIARRANQMPRQGSRSLPFMGLTGLIIAVGCAYLLEYLNTSIRTEHDVRRYLNLPLLGAIIRIKEEGQRLLINVAPKSTLAEVFNATATLVETHARDTNSKLFMIASSKPEEGKSTVSSNLAVALARGGLKVILIDCDLRKAVLHKFFNVDNTVGLASYLLGQGTIHMENGEQPAASSLEDIIKPTEIEGLSLVPAGPHPKNPVSILKSQGFKTFLNDLKARADIVIVDMPPTNIAVDSMLLAPLVDGILLLVSAGETNKDEVAMAKRMLEAAKGKIIGCILNKITIESRGYYYYYYYYYDTYKYYRET